MKKIDKTSRFPKTPEQSGVYFSSGDTHPQMEKIQISLIRKAGKAKRIMCLRSLSQTVIRLARRAIGRANPGYNQREIDLNFIGLNYGEDLASRLRAYLRNRNV